MSGEKTLFFITPIGSPDSPERKRSDAVKDSLIMPACEGYGYKCIRADEMPTPGRIDQQVIDLLLNADLVIADLSDHNPNVFYELAVRHASQKPVILLIEDGEQIPFDIKTHRTIFYDINSGPKFVQAQQELRKQIEAVNEDAFVPDSPIRDSIIGRVRETGDNDLKEVLSIVRTNSSFLYELEIHLKEQLNDLRKSMEINSRRILNMNRNLVNTVGGLESWTDRTEARKTVQERIIELLSHEKEGLTREEILQKVKMSPQSILIGLSRMMKRGVVIMVKDKIMLSEQKNYEDSIDLFEDEKKSEDD